MKNIKFYWLILLIAFTVSFALPANAQTKKVRKKSTVAKKKLVSKTVRPKGAVKIGAEDLSGPVRIGSNNYSPIGSGDGQGSPTQNGKVKIGDKNVNPCGGKNNRVKIAGTISDVKDGSSIKSDEQVGVVNGLASNLAKPSYPAAAKAVRASGVVSIQVLIDEEGNVVSANAVSGHPLLRAASEKAAREAKFYPTLLCGQKVKVSGIITYNFVAQ
jgi:TonB family protein